MKGTGMLLQASHNGVLLGPNTFVRKGVAARISLLLIGIPTVSGEKRRKLTGRTFIKKSHGGVERRGRTTLCHLKSGDG